MFTCLNTGSMAAVSGLSPMISALSVNPSKSTSPVYLLPRFPNKSVDVRDWRVPVEAPSQMWLLHVGNAFEFKDVEGNTEIHVHACSCSYQWFNFQNLFGKWCCGLLFCCFSHNTKFLKTLLLTGYNWQSGRLDPSIMNLKESEYELLPHLVQVLWTLLLPWTNIHWTLQFTEMHTISVKLIVWYHLIDCYTNISSWCRFLSA